MVRLSGGERNAGPCYGPSGHRRPIDIRPVARPRRVFPSDRAPGRFRSTLCRTEISPRSRSNEKQMAGWCPPLAGAKVRRIRSRRSRNVFSTIWVAQFPTSASLPSSAAARMTRPADTSCGITYPYLGKCWLEADHPTSSPLLKRSVIVFARSRKIRSIVVASQETTALLKWGEGYANCASRRA
jgi:hypothetical protein